MTSTPLHSVSVAGVTFDSRGRVLLIRRHDNGEWQAPGGVLELGETFEDGVIREVLEETGVRVTVEGLSGVYKNLQLGVVALVYRCRVQAGRPTATQEADRAEWVSLSKVDEIMTPAFAIRVKDAQAGKLIVEASRTHNGTDLLR